MSLDRLAYKIECISALAGTGCQYGPDAFTPGPAVFAASPLGNIAVYHNKPYCLFSEIICRLNASRCDKPEISFTVFAETICKIMSLATFGNIVQRNTEKSFLANFHCFCKSAFCHFFDKSFVDFNKFSNLFFKVGNASNVELFCFGSQVLSSSFSTRLLSDKFRALLETNIGTPP